MRYYEDKDLKYLLNVAVLNKNGLKISKIARLSETELTQKVAALSEINISQHTQLDALTLSLIEMDEAKFERVVSRNIEQLGFERTMLEVIYPFLSNLGVLWLTGSIQPVQENFITYLIRQKIIAAIDREPLVTDKAAPQYMLYLPEGVRQELTLLFMLYLLRSRGNRVVYLGQDIAISDLKDACRLHQPDYIFTFISETFTVEPVQHYVDRLAENFADTEVLLSGYQVAVQSLAIPVNVHLLRSLDETLAFINKAGVPK